MNVSGDQDRVLPHILVIVAEGGVVNWIVDQSERPVARLVGTAIMCACEQCSQLGFIRGNRVYSWMGVPVGYCHGGYLTNTLGSVVGRIVAADDIGPRGDIQHQETAPRWSARDWEQFLPEPPSVKGRHACRSRAMAAD